MGCLQTSLPKSHSAFKVHVYAWEKKKKKHWKEKFQRANQEHSAKVHCCLLYTVNSPYDDIWYNDKTHYYGSLNGTDP